MERLILYYFLQNKQSLLCESAENIIADQGDKKQSTIG
jgi:hypothetical protein